MLVCAILPVCQGAGRGAGEDEKIGESQKEYCYVLPSGISDSLHRAVQYSAVCSEVLTDYLHHSVAVRDLELPKCTE